jgi:hypothetical protein
LDSRRIILLLAVAVLALPGSALARPSESEFDSMRAKADRDGAARVIVGLQAEHAPEGDLDEAEVRGQRSRIAQERREMLAALDGTRFDVVHTYDSVPFVALAMSRGALNRLERSGKAASLQEDEAVPGTLAQSGPLVEATESVAVGRAGLGQNVAILDTGVQKAHLFLRQASGAAKVVAEACYSADGDCPGGATSSTAAGSGEPCPYLDCDHGTHVAGIAAGRGTSSSGVARDANLISIMVFGNITGCGICTYTSDQIKGLERVNVLSATHKIAAVNMSLGGSRATSNCDSDARKPIIDTLRSKGIATVIASGNSGYNNAVGFPSCISTAVTVGSTTKADAVSSFSNSSSLVELLAPGSAITSSVPDSSAPMDAQASFSGTSMATPHVVGAWAVLKAISPAASVPTVLSALQTTGKPVTDPDNGVTKPRIRVLSAGTRLADTGLRSSSTFTGAGLDVASGGVGLRASGAGSITISGIPAGSTLVSTRLIWTTLGGPDDSVVFTGVPVIGTLLGASRDTCWNVNQLGPNRTYYRAMGLRGNGTYSISGVGGVGGALAQGASLVTVYRKPSGGVGRVQQRIGASSAINGGTASASLTTTGNGTHVRPPAVHVSVGDGSGGQNPLTYHGTAVTPSNFFTSKRGSYWDDERVTLPDSLVPAGTLTRTLALTAPSDCVVMTHASISHETTG